MANPNFDRSLYVRAPVITVSTGVSLALALVDACPKNAPASAKKDAAYLKKLAEKARAELAERNRIAGQYSDEDSRELDNEADRAWGGLRLRLQAMAMLNRDEFPKAARAAELETKLFADGTEFLKAEYASQSTSMASILERINDDGLQKDIDAIAGKEFLDAIRKVQPRYEAMVKERLRRDNTTGQNLTGTVRDIQNAIVDYASKIIGMIERDDASTIETVRLALLPIANYRDASARPSIPREPPPPVQPPPVVPE